VNSLVGKNSLSDNQKRRCNVEERSKVLFVVKQVKRHFDEGAVLIIPKIQIQFGW